MGRYMESKYLNLDQHARARRRKQGKGNFLYVRYADDFVILCNGTKVEAQSMKEELGGFLTNIGLTLSEEKTKVTHITEGFIFLGYKVIREMGQSGKMVPKVLIPGSAIKKFRHKVRGVLAPNTTGEATSAKILALNSIVRGWCQYYRASSSPQIIFGHIQQEIFWGMAHWLGHKYKINMPEIMKRYSEGITFRTKSTRLVMPNEYKAKRLLTKTWHNPYTEKEKIEREKLIVLDSLWIG